MLIILCAHQDLHVVTFETIVITKWDWSINPTALLSHLKVTSSQRNDLLREPIGKAGKSKGNKGTFLNLNFAVNYRMIVVVIVCTKLIIHFSFMQKT